MRHIQFRFVVEEGLLYQVHTWEPGGELLRKEQVGLWNPDDPEELNRALRNIWYEAQKTQALRVEEAIRPPSCEGDR